ncbi:MAG: DUF2283 domain-containing protein [Patescibacteria group bacterium]
MSNQKNSNLKYEYNKDLDVLYITLESSKDSYGHEDDYGVILNYDYATKQLVGVDIWDFRSKIEKNVIIPLPFSIDLKQIYQAITV